MKPIYKCLIELIISENLKISIIKDYITPRFVYLFLDLFNTNDEEERE